jgi:hypothetical protein
MHLYQLRVIDYRRFVDATINLDGKMVAILGPNESGKSSLLYALPLFNDQSRVPTVQLRRGTDQSDGRIVGELTYRLTEDERGEIPYELPKSDALWLVVSKRVGGAVDFALYPRPSRPHSARLLAAAALSKAPESPWWRKIKDEQGEDSDDPLTDALESLARDLGTADEQLPQAVRNSLQLALSRLADLDLASHSKTGRKAIAGLVARLESVLEIEQLPAPQELAATIAAARPRAIPFDDAHRTLGFTHNLTDPNLVAAAFQNLADFGGLNLPALQAAILANDSGAKRTLLGNAVTEINRRLEEDWGQSDLKVDFDVVSLEDVRITVAGRDGEQFDLTHRSDGMRMFLALCAFLAKEGQDPKPVLLIDELERHLHYEAQADIVSMFDARTDVAQVVYTTHSIGCLPQDLGRGVRVVVPNTDAGTSQIDNVWIRGAPGVQPLMAAMGAATLPLQPSRPLVYGEGPCDALLLPSLIRDAIDETPLDYLIVSGASVVSRANFDEFDNSGLRVVYLYDGDQAAKERRRFLHNEKGVPLERILQLEPGVSLEDLVEPGLWVDACNGAIAAIARGDYAVTDTLRASDIRQKQRLPALRAWCTQRGYRTPEKLKLAETIIELMTGPEPRADRRWLDPRRRSGLQAVHQSIVGTLAKGKN